jgi:CBS domain-containing protein
MSKDVKSCGPGDDLHEVLSRMRRFGFVRFPVVDCGFKPIGVVIARDALGVLLAEETYEGSLLRDYVTGIGYH